RLAAARRELQPRHRRIPRGAAAQARRRALQGGAGPGGATQGGGGFGALAGAEAAWGWLAGSGGGRDFSPWRSGLPPRTWPRVSRYFCSNSASPKWPTQMVTVDSGGAPASWPPTSKIEAVRPSGSSARNRARLAPVVAGAVAGAL